MRIDIMSSDWIVMRSIVNGMTDRDLWKHYIPSRLVIIKHHVCILIANYYLSVYNTHFKLVLSDE